MVFFREKPLKKRFGSQAPGFETRAARCKLRISKGKTHFWVEKNKKNRLRRAIWYFLTGNLLNIMITIHP
tara:strand:+ start:181 stop:390 length:210 start_codon:yes stop_codon:yes gene_type:complete